jgi:DNA-binding response OmpR family regulator
MSSMLMVVDDDAYARQAMEDALTDEGYEVMLASDGRDAARLIAERVPHLLLTDLEMPELCGERLVELVQASHPHLPILVLTSRLVIDAEREAQRLGVDGYINKPIELDVLLSRIESSLATRGDVA